MPCTTQTLQIKGVQFAGSVKYEKRDEPLVYFFFFLHLKMKFVNLWYIRKIFEIRLMILLSIFLEGLLIFLFSPKANFRTQDVTSSVFIQNSGTNIYAISFSEGVRMSGGFPNYC